MEMQMYCTKPPTVEVQRRSKSDFCLTTIRTVTESPVSYIYLILYVPYL